MSDSAQTTLAQFFETAKRITIECPGCRNRLEASDGEVASVEDGISLTVYCPSCDGATITVRLRYLPHPILFTPR